MVKYNVFFFKQKTAYDIVDCDWSSDVCSSDFISNSDLRKNGQSDVEKVSADDEDYDTRVFTLEDRSEERRVGKECRSRGSPDH